MHAHMPMPMPMCRPVCAPQDELIEVLRGEGRRQAAQRMKAHKRSDTGGPSGTEDSDDGELEGMGDMDGDHDLGGDGTASMDGDMD